MARELDKVEIYSNGKKYFYNPFFFSTPPSIEDLENCFNIEDYKKNNKVINVFTGRGKTYLVKGTINRNVVIRHYWRGGLIGKILNDKFISIFAGSDRSLLEYELLIIMRKMGLPVPRPVIAKTTSNFLYRTNDIIIEEIPGAKSLAKMLLERALTNEEISKVGDAIARLFRAGVYHSDLNINNILFDAASNPWIIDFDKCYLKKITPNLYKKMVERLVRSFEKEVSLHPAMRWSRLDLQKLVIAIEETFRQ